MALSASSYWRRALIGIVALSSACGRGGAKIADAGGGDTSVTGDDGGDASIAEAGSGDFAAVLAIFAERCTNCHDATKLAVPAYPMLSLTAADAHAALVGHPADQTCGGTRVVPGDPASSYLMKKLTQDPPCDGGRMPRPFEVGMAPPLTPAQLATISSWIAAGAPP